MTNSDCFVEHWGCDIKFVFGQKPDPNDIQWLESKPIHLQIVPDLQLNLWKDSAQQQNIFYIYL